MTDPDPRDSAADDIDGGVGDAETPEGERGVHLVPDEERRVAIPDEGRSVVFPDDARHIVLPDEERPVGQSDQAEEGTED